MREKRMGFALGVMNLYEFSNRSEWGFSIEICGELGGTCVVIEMLVNIALNLETRNQISYACLSSLFRDNEWVLQWVRKRRER